MTWLPWKAAEKNPQLSTYGYDRITHSNCYQKTHFTLDACIFFCQTEYEVIMNSVHKRQVARYKKARIGSLCHILG